MVKDWVIMNESWIHDNYNNLSAYVFHYQFWNEYNKCRLWWLCLQMLRCILIDISKL